MARALLDVLDEWKGRFGPPETGQLERLLDQVSSARITAPADLIRLHETLLFLRAYPRTPAVARRADALLAGFAERTGDLDAFEEPEISGIAGTSLTAVFTYEVARQLAARHPRDLEIAWDRYDEIDRMGPVLARCLPLIAEDWPVEAHTPFRAWIRAARGRASSDLLWLLGRIAALPVEPRTRAELYESLQLPLTWRVGRGRISRSRLRLPGRKLYCHAEPLLRRSDISLARELEGPPLPIRRLSRREARPILDLIVDTSAMRYRELYGFSHPDESGVFHVEAGRGLEIYFFGVPPQWRLPLRAYHGGMFFKNGVPAGYIETLSLCERAEVGFNLYYTFREGESAWIYAKLLQLCRQMLGVNCFVVDPYQIGHENGEAVDSGAFWFYRKLGFRPVEPDVVRLTEREEDRMRRTPGSRSSRRTLAKLAEGYILYEGPGAQAGAWDRFSVRNLGMALERAGAGLDCVPGSARWSPAEKRELARVMEAKRRGSEADYLRRMARHTRLRAAILKLGSSGHAKETHV